MLVNRCRIFLSRAGSRQFQMSNMQKRNLDISGNVSRPKGMQRNQSLSPYAYFLGALPVATFALGTWQCYRLNWKLGLIEKLEKLVKNEPSELPEDLEDVREYTKYRIKGHFDCSAKPIFIFPRQLVQPESSSGQGGGLFSKSKSSEFGAHMVLPFVIDDNLHQKKRILVNVGWVPKKTMESIQNNSGTLSALTSSPNDIIELVGVLRLTEKRQPFQQKDSSTKEHLSRRNIRILSDLFTTEALFLDAHESHEFMLDNDPIRPVGGQTRVTLRNEHLSYILTWYSLTGIFSYYWYSKIFRARL